jgi:hypothetical protein
VSHRRGQPFQVTLGNVAARDYVSRTLLESVNPAGQALRESQAATAPTWRSLQVRLELKL